MTPQETYTSHLSIPYTIIYIHGGAFRDPAITSHSIIPSLPHLFFPSSSSAQQNPRTRIAAIASINYRLSPYYPASRHHPTDHPSRADDDDDDDESRDAKWPDHVHDVRAGIEWLLRSDAGRERAKKKYPAPLNEEEEEEEEKGERIILVGHSVGATIAFAIALGLDGVEGNRRAVVDAV
ncbi:MAG: hypothetical protein Q9197_003677, partial [Variospora fuerteventurae]